MKKILILAGALLVISCHHNQEFANEIKEVDSLQNVANGLSARLDSINGEEIEELADTISGQYDYLTRRKSDFSDRHFWTTDVNYLIKIKGSFEAYTENEEDFHKQLELSKKQLSTLKNSLKDEKLKEEEAEEYVEQESEALENIYEVFTKNYEAVKEAREMWDQLKPRYDSITNYLQTHP